jgi:hypothetical protein
VDGPTTLTNGRIALTANNAGTVTYIVRDMTYTTAGTDTALSLIVGSTVTSGNVTVQANNITAASGEAFVLDVDGGDVNYLINANTFTNNSTTDRTALVDIAGTSIADTTVTSNVFVNTNAASPVEFELITSGGSPTVNLNLTANDAREAGGGVGSGELFINEDAGAINIFERDATFLNTGTRNNPQPTFDPNDVNQFGNLTNPPQTP